MGADDVLNGEAAVLQIAVAADVHFFQVAEQGAAFVPRHIHRSFHHIVAQQRADWNEFDVRNVEPRREIAESRGDGLVRIFVEIYQVHFVDADHEVFDAQQRCDEAVPVGLFHEPMPGID